jgi:hypothetical protein
MHQRLLFRSARLGRRFTGILRLKKKSVDSQLRALKPEARFAEKLRTTSEAHTGSKRSHYADLAASGLNRRGAKVCFDKRWSEDNVLLKKISKEFDTLPSMNIRHAFREILSSIAKMYRIEAKL